MEGNVRLAFNGRFLRFGDSNKLCGFPPFSSGVLIRIAPFPATMTTTPMSSPSPRCAGPRS